MKVGIIRGKGLNEWEMQIYAKFLDFDIIPVGICSRDNAFSIKEIPFEIRRLYRIGQLNKIPLLKEIINYKFSINDHLVGFERAVRDLDILNAAEIFNEYTYQAVKSKKPTVVTVWENLPFIWEFHPIQQHIGTRFRYYKIKQAVIENADHFIAISNMSRDALILEGVAQEKISVVPAAIDTQKFKPSQKDHSLLANLKIPVNSFVVLFVGRLVWEKGITFLLFAMHNVIKDIPNAYLLIVGKGPLEKFLIKQAQKLGIEKNVKFLGFIDYNKMPTYYNLADVLCLPSIPMPTWQEQFGYVMFEAMACGKPVIASTTGAIPEFITPETGILVPPADYIALYDAIIKMHEFNGNFEQNTRKYVEKNFDAVKIAQKMVEIYKTIHVKQ